MPLRCWLGFHKWFYDIPSSVQRRKCMKCHRWQAIVEEYEYLESCGPMPVEVWRWLPRS
jgi:hypothetical protein